MDASQFDALARSAGSLRRRALMRVLGAAVAVSAAGAVAGSGDTAAKRRVRGEHNVRGAKAIMCVEGVTKRVPKKHRRRYLNQGATRGECVAACPAGQKSCNGGCIAADACCTNADCVSPMICDSGVCVRSGPPGCVTTADCPTGQGCLNCACVVVACRTGSACSAGLECVQGQCVNHPPSSCSVNADCTNPLFPYCNGGACVQCPSFACPNGQVCDLGVCTACAAT